MSQFFHDSGYAPNTPVGAVDGVVGLDRGREIDMRNGSQKTLIGLVREHVNACRKALGWSREAVADVIVEAHDRIGGPSTTGIRFEPKTTDTFERAKVNADRIFRWLDDDSKDNNLLPANFLLSILAALPIDECIALLNKILAPLGLTVRRIGDTAESNVPAVRHLVRIAKESAEAQRALAELIDGATLPELQSAERELAEAERTYQLARADVSAQIKRRLQVVA